MASSIFVDTSGFYALLVRRDDRHDVAKSLLQQKASQQAGFVTSDYVLDETATLLRARGLEHLIEPFLNSVLDSRACVVEWMGPERFATTRQFFTKHSDKAWSFTDCSSFCLMQELNLRRALTKDDHFQQAGFVKMLA